MSLRSNVVGFGLSAISKLHVSLPSNVNGVNRKIPVRGQLGKSYLLRSARRQTWKSIIVQNLELGDDQCFIDVGVNIGQTLLELRAARPDYRYYGFEPNPYCIYYVEELIKANKFDRCEVHAYALSITLGAHKLYLNSGNPIGAGASLDNKLTLHSESLNVAALPFDAVRINLPRPGVIKIDVEGSEFATLLGMRQCLETDRPLVICEILNPGKEAADPAIVFERNDRTVSFVMSMGYSVFQIIKSNEFDLSPRFSPVGQLSRVPYEHSSNLCDYLFIPKESEGITAANWWQKYL